LAVTEVKAGPVTAALSYAPALPFPLAVTFAALGVPFYLNGTGGTIFYANFHVQPDLSFLSDFVVQMVYSDDVSVTDVQVSTTYVASTATGTATAVPAPNATLSTDSVDARVEANNVVKTAVGSLLLTQGTVTGASYLIDFDTLGTPPTFATIDAAFTAGSASVVPITGTTQTIPVSALNLVGLDLTTPKRRSLIIANSGSPARTYQLFQITFNRPVGVPIDSTPPTVTATSPVDGAKGISRVAPITASFSEPLAPASLSATTFFISPAASGTVNLAGTNATFTPSTALASNTVYTLTLTAGITDLAGNALALKTWSFTTALGPVPLDLKSAGGFSILASSGIGIAAGTVVTGNVGLSPMGSTGLTGFGLVLDTSTQFAGQFATSPQLTGGKAYAGDYAAPTPTMLSAAIADLASAYADGAGRTNPDYSETAAVELGGRTLLPGLYKWPAAVSITTDVTFSGGANDVWILQVGGALNMAAAASVKLVGGAQAKNIFWVVPSAVVLGAAIDMKGVVLCKGALSTGAGSKMTGRVLSTTSVLLAASTSLTPPP
jgi:hypothetical protein